MFFVSELMIKFLTLIGLLSRSRKSSGEETLSQFARMTHFQPGLSCGIHFVLDLCLTCFVGLQGMISQGTCMRHWPTSSVRRRRARSLWASAAYRRTHRLSPLNSLGSQPSLAWGNALSSRSTHSTKKSPYSLTLLIFQTCTLLSRRGKLYEYSSCLSSFWKKDDECMVGES